MLKWAIIFLFLAIIAGVFGFTGIAVLSFEVAQILVVLFLSIFLVMILAGLLMRH